IDDERLSKILSNSHMIELNQREKLFEKGETYHKGIYMVLEGLILFKKGEELVKEMGSGEILGITTFLGKSSYLVDAEAKNDVKLLFLPEICIYKLITDYEDFKIKFYNLVKERSHLLQGKESIKSYPFSYKPVGNFMTTEVESAHANSDITQISKQMSRKNIGSIVIVDKKGKIEGLITSKLIVHKFLAQENVPLKSKVSDYMEKSPIKVPKDYPLIEVLSEMYSKNQDYAIISENDIPVGIISNKNILKILYRSIDTFSLNIENASSLEELKKIKNNIHLIARTLLENSRQTSEILPTISLIHINIQKKVYKICVQNYLKLSGVKVDEIDHAIIIMGSGARKEMMLNPDQDNGYIFSDNITEEEIRHLFDFGKLFSDSLESVGYEKCKGNVMVTNPEMSMKLSDWKKQIDSLTTNAGDKGFTWSNIIFDMDLFHGNQEIVDNLKNFILKVVSSRPLFLIQMLENETQFKIPITMFGNFIVEKDGEHKGELNLKNSALTFITDIVRAFSLSNKIRELNTVDRIKQLQFKEILSEETVTKILTSYETIVDLALTKEIKDAETGKEISKFINPNALSVFNQNRLKNALGSIAKLLNLSIKYFKGQF
ncbi:MAG: DUF294 nucleotidyltransferase-like domain-containing protein, partial [Calditerrivibrio sp.]|nr:DUF294 nucleotidyltransferase-like domain-containing protein [Calditerrivibrio sp.]